MKTAVAAKTGAALALSLLFLIPAAQATLTPRDGLTATVPADVDSLYGGPAGAELERNYFTAPVEAKAEPAASYRAGRCTVKAIVFEKMRLAQACY